MMFFKHRTQDPELMDELSLDSHVLEKALADIAFVNKILGGNRITIKALDGVISKDRQKTYTILDVGCGAGAMLREVARFCREKRYNVKLIGVDINEKSLELAKQKSIDYPEITYLPLDIIKADNQLVKTNILLCTLTLHHFECEDIVRFIKRFQNITSHRVIINDLQRNRLAYALFWVFSRIFLKTRIARIDGLISIRRGFKRKDILSYTNMAKAKASVSWKWAFRYLWQIEGKDTSYKHIKNISSNKLIKPTT